MIISEALSEPTPVVLEPEPAVVTRQRDVTIPQLPALFDVGYRALAASGAALTGPAYALYRGDPSEVFDLEIGFPVSEPLPAPLPGEPTVMPSTLPAGPALAITHRGSYDTLPASWERLATEAAARGMTPVGWLEVYVTAPIPGADPATLRSDLFLLVDGPA